MRRLAPTVFIGLKICSGNLDLLPISIIGLGLIGFLR
jgi:hypothetical protein